MSLHLIDSVVHSLNGDVGVPQAKINPDFGKDAGFQANGFMLANIEINKLDFISLIFYFMENTNLEDQDCRLDLISEIGKYEQVEGYNKHGFSLQRKL